MFVVRCPLCRRANVQEPLIGRMQALLVQRDRIEGARTVESRLDALTSFDAHWNALQPELQRLREFADEEKRACAHAGARSPEYVVPERRSDPPPPEFRALLENRLAAPKRASDAAAPVVERRELPDEIAAALAALKPQLQPPDAAPPQSYRRLRANLARLRPQLQIMLQHQAPAHSWAAKLDELIDAEPFDREDARSFVEALLLDAVKWRRYEPSAADDIARIAGSCRTALELSLGIAAKAAPAADASAAKPRERNHNQ